MRLKPKSKDQPFDKYAYYLNSVQSPESDVEFLSDTYRELRGKNPSTLREDFCGTFSICCEWVKRNSKNRAFGIDLDAEPIEYGRGHYFSSLKQAQRDRVTILQENVLNPGLPKADVICAMNFSHFVFKDRSMMKSYLYNCNSTLNEGGVFICDVFGGAQCFKANEEETTQKGFTYYWDQTNFDPITNEALFHIHFKPKGQKKIEKVFSYDWRMWSIQELREMLRETGFEKTHVYWEGTTRSGEGDGKFKRTEVGEECEAWIAYVVGEK
jgi:SAM-dependent methyltransferase